MASNNPNDDSEEVSNATSYITLVKKLEKIKLPYKLDDELGPKVLVSYGCTMKLGDLAVG